MKWMYTKGQLVTIIIFYAMSLPLTLKMFIPIPYLLLVGKTGTVFDSKDGIILTDSLGKHFCHLTCALAIPIPGATISSMTSFIKTKDLTKYKVALTLVGTNDLTPKSLWLWYKMKQRKGENTDLTLPPHPKTPPEHIKQQYRAFLPSRN